MLSFQIPKLPLRLSWSIEFYCIDDVDIKTDVYKRSKRKVLPLLTLSSKCKKVGRLRQIGFRIFRSKNKARKHTHTRTNHGQIYSHGPLLSTILSLIWLFRLTDGSIFTKIYARIWGWIQVILEWKIYPKEKKTVWVLRSPIFFPIDTTRRNKHSLSIEPSTWRNREEVFLRRLGESVRPEDSNLTPILPGGGTLCPRWL